MKSVVLEKRSYDLMTLLSVVLSKAVAFSFVVAICWLVPLNYPPQSVCLCTLIKASHVCTAPSSIVHHLALWSLVGVWHIYFVVIQWQKTRFLVIMKPQRHSFTRLLLFIHWGLGAQVSLMQCREAIVGIQVIRIIMSR